MDSAAQLPAAMEPAALLTISSPQDQYQDQAPPTGTSRLPTNTPTNSPTNSPTTSPPTNAPQYRTPRITTSSQAIHAAQQNRALATLRNHAALNTPSDPIPPHPAQIQAEWVMLTPTDTLLESLPKGPSADTSKHLRLIIKQLKAGQGILKHEPNLQLDTRLSTGYRTLDAVLKLVHNLAAPIPQPMAISGLKTLYEVAIAIEGIYRDIDNYSRDSHKAQAELSKLWSIQAIEHKQAFAEEHHLSTCMFRYLILSKTYVRARVEFDRASLTKLTRFLAMEMSSFMIFTRVRLPMIESIENSITGPDLWYRGIRENQDRCAYVVPSMNGAQAVVPTFVSTIKDNYFDPTEFRGINVPTGWDHNIPWPMHPGTRRPGSHCIVCQSRSLCDCQPPRDSFMLEIYDYGRRGRGVRALQRNDSNKVIGEYVGNFIPYNPKNNIPWSVEFRAPVLGDGDTTTMLSDAMDGQVSEANYSTPPIAILDSSSEGNWTRFMNHSCSDANVTLVYGAIGVYHRVLVLTTRDIRIGDELKLPSQILMPKQWNYICYCGSTSCFNPLHITPGTNGNINQAEVAQQSGNTINTTTTQSSSQQFAQIPHLMSTQIHSDINDDSSDETVIKPPSTTTRAKRTRTKAHSNTDEDATESDNPAKRTRYQSKTIKKPTSARSKTKAPKGKQQPLTTKTPESEDKAIATGDTTEDDLDATNDENTPPVDPAAERRERKEWKTRWIGQENPERPRQKGGKGAAPYFAEF